MREWIIVASKSEAKVFERNNKDQDLRWIKTFTNKKGRRKEREFETDKPGSSYAKYSGVHAPHNLEGKHSHAEIISEHFAHVIADFIKSAHDQNLFRKVTVLAGPKLLGKLRHAMQNELRHGYAHFIDKNIEKANSDEIKSFVT